MIDENSIIIGINKEDNELIIAEWDNEDNRYSGCGYRELVDEERGEELAIDRLKDCDYWEELGYLNSVPDIIKDNIDFESISEELISSDGWENVNGEYYELGEYNDKNYYSSFSSGWSRQENITEKDLKVLFITKEQLKDIQTNKKLDIVQDRTNIIKTLIEDYNFEE